MHRCGRGAHVEQFRTRRHSRNDRADARVEQEFGKTRRSTRGTPASGDDRAELRPVTNGDRRCDLQGRHARAMQGPTEFLFDDRASPQPLVAHEQLSCADPDAQGLFELQRREGGVACGHRVGAQRALRRIGVELVDSSREELEEIDEGSPASARLVVWPPNSVISVVRRIRHRPYRIGCARRPPFYYSDLPTLPRVAASVRECECLPPGCCAAVKARVAPKKVVRHCEGARTARSNPRQPIRLGVRRRRVNWPQAAGARRRHTAAWPR